MKIIRLIIISLLLTGCFKKSINVSGVYITQWSNEFAEVRDTIQIQAIQPNEYKIIRRSCIIKNKEPEYKLVHWTGTYNGDDQTLVIHSNARILYFKEDEMRMGTTTYKKL